MKKPIIKNWIKYWTGTLAISGLLLMGACDNNEQAAAEAEEVVPERENVSVVPEEEVVEEPAAETVFVEEEEPNNIPQEAQTLDATFLNLEDHLEEYQQVNEAIRVTLTGIDTSEVSVIQDTSTTTPYNETDRNVYEPLQEQNTLDEEMQDTTAVEQDQNQRMSQQGEQDLNLLIIERYQMVNPQELGEEDRQRLQDIMSAYTLRMEKMAGQINPETGAYVSPETAARPTESIESIQEQIRDKIVYPQNAIAGGIEGIVFVRFVVDEQGNVTQAEAVEDLFVSQPGSEMAMKPLGETSILETEEEEAVKEKMKEEAVRAIEATSGQWLPGEQGGQKVPTEVQLPVQFEIGGVEIDEDVPLDE